MQRQAYGLGSNGIAVWLLTLGVGLAGCSGGAGTGGSGGAGGSGGSGGTGGACSTDSSSPLTLGALITMTTGSSAALESLQKDQVDMVVAEVNQGCGTVGDASQGAEVQAIYRDLQDDNSLSAGLTTEVIDAGAIAIVGGGGSAVTLNSAPLAVDAGIPFAMSFAASPSVTGCTTAELADAGTTKSTAPVYAAGQCWDQHGLTIRTAGDCTKLGTMVGEYTKATYPTLTSVAIITRNDSFGIPTADTFAASFSAQLGNTVVTTIDYAANASQADFTTHLIAAANAGSFDLVVGAYRVGELKAMLNAYADLITNDAPWTSAGVTRPANFDQVRFVLAGSLRADYGDLTAAALAAMHARAVGLTASWDATTTAYQKWLTAYQAFDPSGTASFHAQMRAYDAAMLLMLALTKANSTDGAAIAAALPEVANPPGEIIYPGEFAKARALLEAGTDIDYQGASGPLDLESDGNAAPIVYEIWDVTDTGAPETVGPISDDFTAP